MTNKTALTAGLAFISGAAIGGALTYRIVAQKLLQEFEETLKRETDAIRASHNAVFKPQYPSAADAAKDLIPADVRTLIQETYEVTDKNNPKQKIAYDKIVKSSVGEGKIAEEKIVTVNVFDAPEIPLGDIHPISAEEFGENEWGYITASLLYYAKDDILAGTDEEVIHDAEKILGENFREEFGKISESENVLYVANKVLDILYEVERIDSTYSFEVLGVHPDEIRNAHGG